MIKCVSLYHRAVTEQSNNPYHTKIVSLYSKFIIYKNQDFT